MADILSGDGGMTTIGEGGNPTGGFSYLGLAGPAVGLGLGISSGNASTIAGAIGGGVGNLIAPGIGSFIGNVIGRGIGAIGTAIAGGAKKHKRTIPAVSMGKTGNAVVDSYRFNFDEFRLSRNRDAKHVMPGMDKDIGFAIKNTQDRLAQLSEAGMDLGGVAEWVAAREVEYRQELGKYGPVDIMASGALKQRLDTIKAAEEVISSKFEGFDPQVKESFDQMQINKTNERYTRKVFGQIGEKGIRDVKRTREGKTVKGKVDIGRIWSGTPHANRYKDFFNENFTPSGHLKGPSGDLRSQVESKLEELGNVSGHGRQVDARKQKIMDSMSPELKEAFRLYNPGYNSSRVSSGGGRTVRGDLSMSFDPDLEQMIREGGVESLFNETESAIAQREGIFNSLGDILTSFGLESLEIDTDPVKPDETGGIKTLGEVTDGGINWGGGFYPYDGGGVTVDGVYYPDPNVDDGDNNGNEGDNDDDDLTVDIPLPGIIDNPDGTDPNINVDFDLDAPFPGIKSGGGGGGRPTGKLIMNKAVEVPNTQRNLKTPGIFKYQPRSFPVNGLGILQDNNNGIVQGGAKA